MFLTKVLWKSLVVFPCVLGVNLITSMSPSAAEIATTAESEPTSSTEVTTPLESQPVDENVTLSENSDLEVSQTTVNPDTASEMNPDSSDPDTQDTPVESSDTNREETPAESNTSEPQTTASDSNRWHFLIQPYLYLPVTIYGDTTVGRVTREINVGFDRIKTAVKDDLNFAFFSTMQAWTPNYHVGILANVDYLSTSTDNSFTRTVRRPRLANFIPSEFQTNVDADLWSVDLAVAYRFYNQSKVNPKGVSTEFDLGPLLFDVFGGLDITSVNHNLDLSTNLGGEASFDGGTTVVSPLLGGRLRVNVAPKLAVVAEGSVAGFGISGLTKWGALGGIDWMFSGNTSLGLGYRFGYTSYNRNLDNDKDFGLTLNQNGPYLSFSFRF